MCLERVVIRKKKQRLQDWWDLLTRSTEEASREVQSDRIKYLSSDLVGNQS
jgi:hypothetical protein